MRRLKPKQKYQDMYDELKSKGKVSAKQYKAQLSPAVVEYFNQLQQEGLNLKLAVRVMATGWPTCIAKGCLTKAPISNNKYTFLEFCSHECNMAYANEIRDYVEGSTYVIKDVANRGAVVECSECKVTRNITFAHLKAFGCKCGRGLKISGSQKLATTQVDEILAKQFLKRLSPYKGLNKQLKVECLKCGHIRSTIASSPLKNDANCPSSKCLTIKMRNTYMEKYGTTSGKVPGRQEKFKATCQARYGVDFPMQCPTIFAKMQASSELVKTYMLAGREVNVQGYEPQGIDYLLKVWGVNPNHLSVGTEIPPVSYIFEGVDRNYFPDIYYKTGHHIIEVKSSYTFNYAKAQNIAKARSCVRKGFKFTFLIIDGDGNVTEKHIRRRSRTTIG